MQQYRVERGITSNEQNSKHRGLYISNHQHAIYYRIGTHKHDRFQDDCHC